MRMWTIFFLAFLATAIAQDTYLVVVPSDVRPGVPLSISVNILQSHGNVNVKADLVDKRTKNHVATTHGTFSQNVPGTLTIQVPDSLGPGSYSLAVHGTHGLKFTNETDLNYQSKSVSIFIQTDKAMYKPGQTVNFRAFAIYPNMSTYTGAMDIEIYDPNTNKIKQILGARDSTGVITNFLEVDTQPVLGDWKIKVMAHGKSTEKTFTIAHYVLPKFEVTVELPSFALSADDNLMGTVRAKYTYGKPVEGTVTLRAKNEYWYRPWNYHGDEPMIEQTLTLTNGEAKFTLSGLSTLNKYLNERYITVEANVTESLTKITLSGNSKIQFHQHAEKMEFLASNPSTFKPGLPYTAYIRVTRQDGSPITGTKQSVVLHNTITAQLPTPSTTPQYYWGPQTTNYKLGDQTFTLPDTGVVAIQVQIPENATSVSLRAEYGSVSSYKSLQKSYSPSDSYIQLFLRSTTLRAGSVANFEVQSTEGVQQLTYQILSRGSIVHAGSVDGNNQQSFTFSVPLTDKMAPNARIVTYYVRTDGEVVTDSISFNVAGVFQNQVALSFDKTKAQPGENVNVRVTADPMSTVNLLAVDQSVLLLKSGNDITQEEVIDELKTYDTIHHHDNGPIFFGGGGIMPLGRKKRMIWWPYPTYYGGSDASQIFANAGVKVMTDALVFKHVEQHPLIYPEMAFGGAIAPMAPMPAMAMTNGMAPNPAPSSQLKEVGRVRSVFPETWLWTNASIGSDGQVQISTTVPDTITSWIASAFAINTASGLGIADTTAKIEAFKPFFVSLNLPYSVVRGEQLVLQANVFNYLSQDTDVLVTLEKNDDFRSIVMDASNNPTYVSQTQTSTIHVPSGQAKSVFFPIVPAGLGMIDLTVKAQSPLAADGVRRQLLVEPEGVPKEYNVPILIDLKDSNTFTKDVPITLPASVVAGSQHVKVTAIGDLMGPTVNNLDKLLRMPNGCGEQTMLGFAPDVFVSNYLSATHQLSSDIEEKAIGFMEKGYQRELTFQHKDGSFSAFGDRDKSGSMWLTAFVVKSFHQAKSLIFIDDETLQRAIDWMISRQNGDGSFPEPGRVIHKDMQGGSASGPGLTAFVLISLLENNDLKGGVAQRIQTASQRAVSYLEGRVATLSDDYALAIVSYSLALAKSGSAGAAFSRLNNDAIIKDGMKHWHKAQTQTDSHHYWSPPHRQSNPIDIEMTSYALLVYASNNQFTDGLSVMKWITSQRNPQGGFSSTQDTVMALQALSEFAKMAYSSNFDIQMTATAGSFSHQFSVNAKNALLLQSVELPTIPSQVTISATGHGMGLIQVSVFFNVEQEIEEPSFEMTVTMMKDTLDAIQIETCAHWLKVGASGMTVQEIGVPTGFEADLESITQLPTLKKIETENRKIVIYLDEISTTPTCIVVDMFRTGLVAKTQPAAIRIYDYYEPANQVTKFYQSQRLKNSNICDVCADCGCTA
ncbi:CD109 antigen-like isoform X2 [Crassostrea angulata]|uniref:CD109 antigen-like isoform X2 n=1 Tax=Magallana angulata TaxID=2784310 RepID=UPI0022B20374|nr:CD109 antigen-like isoform X2 [Crassostrea angulata]